jgi:hypothetical protein
MNQPKGLSLKYIIPLGLVSIVLIVSLPALRMYEAHVKSLDDKLTAQQALKKSADFLDPTDSSKSSSPEKSTTANKNYVTDEVTEESKSKSDKIMSSILSQEQGQIKEFEKFETCMITSVSFQFPNIISKTYTNRRDVSCDVASFDNMNGASVRAQLETNNSPFQTGKIGPYRDTATKNLSTSSFPFTFVGNQKYSVSFEVKIGLLDIIKHPEFALGGSIFSDATYYPLKARQNLNLFWAPGDPAYVLVTPDGRIYLMTQYSAALLPQLNRDNLEILNRLLVLPTNWKFIKVRVTKPVWITDSFENGFIVEKLFDNLGNFYVRAKLLDSKEYAKEISSFGK